MKRGVCSTLTVLTMLSEADPQELFTTIQCDTKSPFNFTNERDDTNVPEAEMYPLLL